MMKKEALERQSTKYLILLDEWYALRWKRRLRLLNECTEDIWLIREVLKEKREIADKHLLNTEYGTIMFRSTK